MAKYKAYPEYKDSGVEWLGEVPTHWVCTALKRLCSLTTGLTPPTNNEDNYADEGHPWVRPEDINEHGLETRASKYVSGTGWKLLRHIKPNSTLICCIGTIGKCGYVREAVSTNQQITAATFLNHERFYFYLMQAARTSFEELATGNVLKILNSERLGALNVVKVEGKESDTIAEFLDHETAKIDNLIEKQQQLIELLKEKCQAVISHAVTKGLNPDVPMKDSGVEWLGEVPEHWDVKRIKHFGKVVGGFAFKSGDFTDEGYPVIKISNVSHLNFDWTDSSFLPHSFSVTNKEYLAPKGALIFAMTRPVIAGGIKVTLLDNDSAPLVNQRVGFMVVKQEDISRYILISTQSSSFLAQFVNNMTITNQPNISSEGIESIYLPFPPVNELSSILKYLDNLEGSYSDLIDKASTQVSLLQERRTALISAAVTGKIDVRDWVAPNACEAEVSQEVTA